jgi:dsDNA-binding SOS-regulon protein
MVRTLCLGSLLSVCIAVSGCVSLPREAVRLSSELGTSVSESRAAHLALVRKYMAEKRERIDEFMFKEWIPEFARQVFSRETVRKEWERIAVSGDPAERLEFITGLGTMLQQEINMKRSEIIKPVDEMERLLLDRINLHYDGMLAANATITAFLDSATSVRERQQETLKIFHAEDRLSGLTAAADDIVDKIIQGRDAYEKNRDEISGILDKVRGD